MDHVVPASGLCQTSLHLPLLQETLKPPRRSIAPSMATAWWLVRGDQAAAAFFWTQVTPLSAELHTSFSAPAASMPPSSTMLSSARTTPAIRTRPDQSAEAVCCVQLAPWSELLQTSLSSAPVELAPPNTMTSSVLRTSVTRWPRALQPAAAVC